jgi:hypothetical protein
VDFISTWIQPVAEILVITARSARKTGKRSSLYHGIRCCSRFLIPLLEIKILFEQFELLFGLSFVANPAQSDDTAPGKTAL